MRTYIAEIRHASNLIGRLRIEALDRGAAVHKAQLHFWYTYHGRLGTADQTIVINDPYDEVQYSNAFACNDKKNRLLSEGVITRLLQQAHGELARETRSGSPHSPRGPVRRTKRRRDFGKFIAPSVRQMKNAKLYYRINTQSQTIRNGRRYRKRKYKDIPLEARTLVDAVLEIKVRKLFKLNAEVQKRKMMWRDLRTLECIAGLVATPIRMSRKFRTILEQYVPATVTV